MIIILSLLSLSSAADTEYSNRPKVELVTVQVCLSSRTNRKLHVLLLGKKAEFLSIQHDFCFGI